MLLYDPTRNRVFLYSRVFTLAMEASKLPNASTKVYEFCEHLPTSFLGAEYIKCE